MQVINKKSKKLWLNIDYIDHTMIRPTMPFGQWSYYETLDELYLYLKDEAMPTIFLDIVLNSLPDECERQDINLEISIGYIKDYMPKAYKDCEKS